MNMNLTEIAFVLDRSGSMDSMDEEAIGGFNAFLEEQKRAPGDVRFTLVLFDNEYLKVVDHQPLQSVKPLDDETFVPRGSTALLDAMGRTIEEIGARLAKTPEHDRPSKVIIACLTDGEENASKQYSNDQLAKMIEHQRTVYSWEFIFLGASLGSRQMARSWTVPDEDIDDMETDGIGMTTAQANISKRVMMKRMKQN